MLLQTLTVFIGVLSAIYALRVLIEQKSGNYDVLSCCTNRAMDRSDIDR